jgi:hypothetical protein
MTVTVFPDAPAWMGWSKKRVRKRSVKKRRGVFIGVLPCGWLLYP